MSESEEIVLGHDECDRRFNEDPEWSEALAVALANFEVKLYPQDGV